MSLDKVDHFIVLMLENRSFDHLFGLRPGVNGILDAHGKPHLSNVDAHGKRFQAKGGAPFTIPTKHGQGPFHNLIDVNEQLFGKKDVAAGAATPEMAGFVLSYLEALADDTNGHFTDDDVAIVMKSFDPGALPATTALADNFVLCENWFAEVPGPTHPNRLYMHAGTSAGFVHNVFQRPFDLLTIYELLTRQGKTWAVYDFDVNEVKHFTRIEQEVQNFRTFSPRFGQDVETGQLPNYSFVVPRFNSTHHTQANDQHPPHDVRWGDELVADVYDALRQNDALWRKSAFIVTYDEHGGFFDHVPPPKAVSPDGIDSPRPDDNFHGHAPPPFKFDRLGVRVPALIASPWVGKGVVASEQYQHTSILKTVRERFQIQQALSKREAKARSLAELFDQKHPRDTPEQLPRPSIPKLPQPTHHANPGNQPPDELARQMALGVFRTTRPSHPDDDTSPPRIPGTQAELSELVHRRWSTHRKWLGG
jgi:phospholipase C